MELRPYQHQVVSDLRQAIAEGHKRVVLQLATGAGKTRVAADIIERAIAKGKRVQFMAPRRELIFQSRDAFRALGIEAGVIMAGEELFPSQVYVTSFDTLHSRAALRFKMKWPESDLVIADEAHLALSKSRQAILSRYPIVIGLTATPALPGGKGLGSFFTKMVTGPPISELQRDGYLVPVSYMAPSKPDLEGIKVVKGDYVVDQLGMVMDKPKLVGDIVDHWLQFANNRPTVVYAVNRRHGRHLCEAFCAKGVEAEYVDGETDNKERKAILERVSSGKTRVLCNVFVCLDEKTEILTKDGWKNRLSISMDDEVANWNNGDIWFSKPLMVFSREVEDDEEMVCLHTRNRSFRVTADHQMLWRTGSKWKKSKARDIVGRAIKFPVSGVSKPFTPQSIPEGYEYTSGKVASIAYNLRASGYSKNDALAEAKRRVSSKAKRMQHKPLEELSLNDCWIIGFWIGDGSKQNISDGSVRYSFSQSLANESILKELVRRLSEEGYDFRVRKAPMTGKGSGGSYNIFISNGTGGGGQQRQGFFGISRFLSKTLSDEVWSFSEAQFTAFLEGLWLADGNHSRKKNNGKAIWSANRTFADRLQAILVCRGYKSNLRSYKNGNGLIHRISYSKRDDHACTKHRPTIQPAIKGEHVWCASTESGNLVTRRDGYVTIMGNCSYGIDIPSLEVCVLARPTKSVVLYFQTIGRVLRPSPGKEGALVIDHAGAWYEHGAVEDRVPWDLDPGSSVSERIKKAREETKAPKQLVCPQCKTGFTARRSCPACGYELIPPTEAIPVYEGKLIEVKNSWAKDKQKVYSELLGLAQEKERSTGWVAHAYKKLFGVWPKGLAPQPLIAGPDLRRWVKGQDARFAIAKARGRKRA